MGCHCPTRRCFQRCSRRRGNPACNTPDVAQAAIQQASIAQRLPASPGARRSSVVCLLRGKPARLGMAGVPMEGVARLEGRAVQVVCAVPRSLVCETKRVKLPTRVLWCGRVVLRRCVHACCCLPFAVFDPPASGFCCLRSENGCDNKGCCDIGDHCCDGMHRRVNAFPCSAWCSQFISFRRKQINRL